MAVKIKKGLLKFIGKLMTFFLSIFGLVSIQFACPYSPWTDTYHVSGQTRDVSNDNPLNDIHVAAMRGSELIRDTTTGSYSYDGNGEFMLWFNEYDVTGDNWFLRAEDRSGTYITTDVSFDFIKYQYDLTVDIFLQKN